MKYEVGQFTCDSETGTVVGPAEYMKDRGHDKLEEILSGKSVVFNMGCARSPNVYVAMLVALQTDFAGWRGMRQLCAGLGV